MAKRISTWKGVLFIGTAQAWTLAVTFLAAPALGRLLQPSDFGLLATSAPIVGFVATLQNLGLSQAIIQRETITRGQINALFWLSVLVCLTLILGLLTLAPLAAEFFREPRLSAVIAVSATLMLISVLASQPIALLTRDLRFRTLALLEVVGSTLGAILAVTVAWYTQSYWSLLLPIACGRVVDLLGAAIAVRWYPGRPIWDGELRQMIRFGASLATFNLLNYLARHADNLMIAKVYGATALGFYDRAYKIMLLPLAQATGPLSRVVTPILSRLQGEPGEYRRTYDEAVTFLMLTVQPGALCAVIYSDTTVTLLLGSKWSDASPIFAWLGIAGLHQIFTSTLGWLLISQGRVRDLAILGTVNSATTVASFAMGLPWGALGVAISYVCSDYLLRLPFTWYLACRKGPIHPSDILRITIPHILGLLASALALSLAKIAMSPSTLLPLISLACIAYLINVAVLSMFSSKRVILSRAINMLNSWLQK